MQCKELCYTWIASSLPPRLKIGRSSPSVFICQDGNGAKATTSKVTSLACCLSPSIGRKRLSATTLKTVAYPLYNARLWVWISRLLTMFSVKKKTQNNIRSTETMQTQTVGHRLRDTLDAILRNLRIAHIHALWWYRDIHNRMISKFWDILACPFVGKFVCVYRMERYRKFDGVLFSAYCV